MWLIKIILYLTAANVRPDLAAPDTATKLLSRCSRCFAPAPGPAAAAYTCSQIQSASSAGASIQSSELGAKTAKPAHGTLRATQRYYQPHDNVRKRRNQYMLSSNFRLIKQSICISHIIFCLSCDIFLHDLFCLFPKFL